MTSFFGRRVVWAAFIIAVFGWGIGFYGPPIFLHNVVQRTGWGLRFVSAVVTFHFLCGTIVVARLPWLHARFGVPVVTLIGATALAVGVGGWSLAQQPWQLVLGTVLTGMGWATMNAGAMNAIIAPWFVHTRPRALATAYNGGSVGGTIFPPLWAVLITSVGFPLAAAALGLLMVSVVLWLSRTILRRTPAEFGQAQDGDAPGVPAASLTSPFARSLPGHTLWIDRGFATLTGGMALGLFAQIGLIAHLFSLLVPALGTQSAGLLMGLATACAIAGRSIVGWLMPVGADRRIVACLSYAAQVLASVILMVSGGTSTPLLVLGVLLFGTGIGNATSLPPLIAQVEFVKEEVQRVVSLIVSLAQAAYAFAPAAFGMLLATSGTTPAYVFAAAAAIQVAAIACLLAGRRRGSSRAAAVTSSR